MRVVIVLSVLAVVGAGPAPATVDTFRYHELVGIPRATAIRAAEEAELSPASGRILNGRPATLGQFPFFGGLVINMSDGRTSSCGSSLVTNTKLITAAHCWVDSWSQARGYTVVLGSIRLFTGGTRIYTTNVVIHQGWLVRPSPRHDIAIITITRVTFSNTIRPINLASGSNTFAGQTAQAIGVGMTSNSAPVGAHTFLAWVSLPIITNSQCAVTYPNFVDNFIVCTASVNGGNTCTGDSGGPVVVGNTLVGVVSFGSTGGCEALQPAGHTRISAYRDWINARL